MRFHSAFAQTKRCFRFASLCALAFLVSGCASYQPDYDAIYASSTTENRARAWVVPVDADMRALIQQAQSYHPAVQAALADVESARAELISAGAFMDPEFTLTQGLNDTGYRTLGLSQEIPVFNRRSMAIEQGKATLRAAKAQLAQAQADVAANVVAAFSEYLYVRDSVALQRELVVIQEHFVAVVEQQYAAGSAAMSDLLRAQNALDEARSELDNLQAAQTSQQARLNGALGRDARAALPDHFDLEQTHAEFAALPAEISDLYQLVQEQNAGLRATQYELEALQVARDVAGTAGLPRLMVGMEYMDTDMGDGTTAGMVSVSLPIWRNNYRAQRAAADANFQGGLARLEAARLDAQAALSIALFEWREAERNRALYGDVLVQRAEQALASVLAKYTNNNATYADVVTSQQEWLGFSLAYRRALANQLSALATIQALIVPVHEVD
ncbi:TolC family protein [Alishewanella jeotgali]|uniref:Outer membrane efflux protein n=1 Tax=Alishewanella jeotgali KCTC 22429 TaxID=1129374 RepID=H3ZC72_9ALTE|nr:TolC family protein [Alishewanella jeotgali]EHR41917.1 outer membrane efflux protein [Alishewanella jeotgali KCTC 22429]